jgi:hypothetical protein
MWWIPENGAEYLGDWPIITSKLLIKKRKWPYCDNAKRFT